MEKYEKMTIKELTVFMNDNNISFPKNYKFGKAGKPLKNDRITAIKLFFEENKSHPIEPTSQVEFIQVNQPISEKSNEEAIYEKDKTHVEFQSDNYIINPPFAGLPFVDRVINYDFQEPKDLLIVNDISESQIQEIEPNEETILSVPDVFELAMKSFVIQSSSSSSEEDENENLKNISLGNVLLKEKEEEARKLFAQPQTSMQIPDQDIIQNIQNFYEEQNKVDISLQQTSINSKKIDTQQKFASRTTIDVERTKKSGVSGKNNNPILGYQAGANLTINKNINNITNNNMNNIPKTKGKHDFDVLPVLINLPQLQKKSEENKNHINKNNQRNDIDMQNGTKLVKPFKVWKFKFQYFFWVMFDTMSLNGKELYRFNDGDCFMELDRKDDWLKIQFRENTGYVKGKMNIFHLEDIIDD